jgi:hypothetical protein
LRSLLRFNFLDEQNPELLGDDDLQTSKDERKEKESLVGYKQFVSQPPDEAFESDSLQSLESNYQARKRKRNEEANFSLEKVLRGSSSPYGRVLLSPEKEEVFKEIKKVKKTYDKVYQLSSIPYIAKKSPYTPSPTAKNSPLIEDYLKTDGEEFDPLVFSIPSVMREEIAERQKGISSDWPLIVTPSATGSVGDRELYEKEVILAQISNAAQMSLSMWLKGDSPTAALFLLDVYSLSTAAATTINNERVALQYPGSEAILNGEEFDLVRPRTKDRFSAFKSSALVKGFFRSGGGTQFPSQYLQDQEKTPFLDRSNTAYPSTIQFPPKERFFPTDYQTLVQDVLSQVQSTLAFQKSSANRPFQESKVRFRRGNTRSKQRSNRGQFRGPPFRYSK